MAERKPRRLSQEQMDKDQGRIYGRAPIPGARFEVHGVFYDGRGYECLLPGQKLAAVPAPQKVEEPKEPTEQEIKISQFQEFLNGLTQDEDKEALRDWMAENVGKKYAKNMKLSTMKDRALQDYTDAVNAEVGGEDGESGAADADKEAA